ncbi:MAG TPA: OmpA family protein [Spirochaetota bacterium]|nr:MAG: OmpA family protein [Spirochaetes bacterium ADurb.Bin133]HPY88474.1 OmpA family protein [Spirochaetota bacterium]
MRKFFIGFYILYSLALNSSEKEINFILNMEFSSVPMTYEGFSENYIISFNGIVQPGFQYSFFELGFSFDEIYFSYTNRHFLSNCGMNILKFRILPKFNINPYISIEFGSGIGLFNQSLEYSQIKRFSNVYALDISSTFNLYLKINNRYINFQINNEADICIENSRISGIYNAFLRININPNINFINLFSDLGLVYQNNSYYTLNTVFFSWKSGISLNLKIPRFIDDYGVVNRRYVELSHNEPLNIESSEDVDSSFMITEKDATEDISVPIASIDESGDDGAMAALFEPSLFDVTYGLFINSKIGDTIPIRRISFKQNSGTPIENSFEQIDIIYEILRQTRIGIAISCYSDYQGDPDKEIELSKSRANYIRNYLIKRGVMPKRVRIMASARIYKNDVPDNERFIEVKIIEK